MDTVEGIQARKPRRCHGLLEALKALTSSLPEMAHVTTCVCTLSLITVLRNNDGICTFTESLYHGPSFWLLKLPLEQVSHHTEGKEEKSMQCRANNSAVREAFVPQGVVTAVVPQGCHCVKGGRSVQHVGSDFMTMLNELVILHLSEQAEGWRKQTIDCYCSF